MIVATWTPSVTQPRGYIDHAPASETTSERSPRMRPSAASASEAVTRSSRAWVSDCSAS